MFYANMRAEQQEELVTIIHLKGVNNRAKRIKLLQFFKWKIQNASSEKLSQLDGMATDSGVEMKETVCCSGFLNLASQEDLQQNEILQKKLFDLQEESRKMDAKMEEMEKESIELKIIDENINNDLANSKADEEEEREKLLDLKDR